MTAAEKYQVLPVLPPEHYEALNGRDPELVNIFDLLPALYEAVPDTTTEEDRRRASLAKPVAIADFCQRPRRARSASAMVISPKSAATVAPIVPSTIPSCATNGTPMFVQIGQERAYKPGWAKVQYKEKFGTWPPWGAEPQPIPPTPEVRSWVRSRMIAYAKRRAFA